MSAHHLRPLAVVLATALLAACQSSTSSQAPSAPLGQASTALTPETSAGPVTSSAGPLPPAFASVFDVPPDPIAVTSTLDEAAAVEKVVAVGGGQVTATAADGTAFTLDIPAGALVADTRIRLTPVATIAGMPFGTDPHAIVMGPAGLHFKDFVTLTIDPKVAIPPAQQVVFGFEGDGENLILGTPVVDSASISIRLLHFSGAGVTTATAADVAAAQPRLGADVAARTASAIGAQLAAQRQAQLSGSPSAPLDQAAMRAFLQQYLDEVVTPGLTAATGATCAAGKAALRALEQYVLLADLLGVADATASVDPGALGAIADRCVRDEYQRCHDDHVVQNMEPVWVSMTARLLVLHVSPSSPVFDQLAEYVRRCLVFHLDFQSQVTMSNSGTGWDSFVKSAVDLRYRPEAFHFTRPAATLENWHFEFKPGPGCEVESRPGNGTFRVMDFDIFTDPGTSTDGTGPVHDLELDYNPGPTGETAILHCKGQDFTIPQAGFWSGVFIHHHRDESGIIRMPGATGTFDPNIPSQSFVFEATGWEIRGGQLYATKGWTLSEEDAVEAGTFTLYHNPE